MKSLALITGGTSGIGLEAAFRAAQRGYSLALVYRENHERAEVACLRLRSAFPQIEVAAVSYDLSDPTKVDEFVKYLGDLSARFNIEVFVGSHGRSVPSLFLQKKTESIVATIQEHLLSNIMILHKVLPGMCIQKYGRVVFITSLAAHKINRGQSDYALSKSALETFVKSLTAEYHHRNINFNCISSGFAATNLSKSIYENFSDDQKKNVVPIEQIGDLIDLMISKSATHLTGSVVRIDGGQFCLNNNSEYHSLSYHIKDRKGE